MAGISPSFFKVKPGQNDHDPSAAKKPVTDQNESDSDNKPPEPEESFSELMRRIFGCRSDELIFVIPNACNDSKSWLDKYKKASLSGDGRVLTGNLMLPGAPIKGIKVSKKGIEHSMKCSSYKDMMFTAFAMAVLAKGHPEIRRKGAQFTGNEQEKAFLMLAVQKVGLAVNEKQAKEIRPMADKITQGLESQGMSLDALWQEFCQTMNDFQPGLDNAPPDTPPPPAGNDTPQSDQNTAPPKAETPAKPKDPLFNKAVEHVIDAGEVSTAILQNKLPFISDQGAAELIRKMEESSVVSPPDEQGARKVLMTMEEFNDRQNSGPDTKPGPSPAEQEQEPQTAEPAQKEDAAPEKPEPAPSTLTDAFNRTIPDNIRADLMARNINPEIYKKITEDVIQSEDARRNTLREKYKDAFNLTGRQLDLIVEKMDQEGITTLRNGNRRVINYNKQGQPKDPAML